MEKPQNHQNYLVSISDCPRHRAAWHDHDHAEGPVVDFSTPIGPERQLPPAPVEVQLFELYGRLGCE